MDGTSGCCVRLGTNVKDCALWYCLFVDCVFGSYWSCLAIIQQPKSTLHSPISLHSTIRLLILSCLYFGMWICYSATEYYNIKSSEFVNWIVIHVARWFSIRKLYADWKWQMVLAIGRFNVTFHPVWDYSIYDPKISLDSIKWWSGWWYLWTNIRWHVITSNVWLRPKYIINFVQKNGCEMKSLRQRSFELIQFHNVLMLLCLSCQSQSEYGETLLLDHGRTALFRNWFYDLKPSVENITANNPSIDTKALV